MNDNVTQEKEVARRSPNELPSYDEGREIEQYVSQRVRNGDFKPLPDNFPKYWGTGVHISTNDEGLLAYYPTRRNIQDRRAVQIKPGKYLNKYFSLSSDEIREFSGLITGNVTLETTNRASQMIAWYRDLDENGVVDSCMSKEVDESNHSWPRGWHPLEAYDQSDVELAVMLDSCGKVKARALYNKNTMEYPMIYGHWEKMKILLDLKGYKHGSLEGAKIKRIEIDPDDIDGADENRTYILMPYIDGHRGLSRDSANSTSVDIYDDYVLITEDGQYSANEYDEGVIKLKRQAIGQCDCCGTDFYIESQVYTFENSDSTYCYRCNDDETERVYISASTPVEYGDYFLHPSSELGDYIRCRTAPGSHNQYSRTIYAVDEDVAAELGYVPVVGTNIWYHLATYNADRQYTRPSQCLIEMLDGDGEIVYRFWRDIEFNFFFDGRSRTIVKEQEEFCVPLRELRAHYTAEQLLEFLPKAVVEDLPAIEPVRQPLPVQVEGGDLLQYSTVGSTTPLADWVERAISSVEDGGGFAPDNFRGRFVNQFVDPNTAANLAYAAAHVARFGVPASQMRETALAAGHGASYESVVERGRGPRVSRQEVEAMFGHSFVVPNADELMWRSTPDEFIRVLEGPQGWSPHFYEAILNMEDQIVARLRHSDARLREPMFQASVASTVPPFDSSVLGVIAPLEY